MKDPSVKRRRGNQGGALNRDFRTDYILQQDYGCKYWRTMSITVKMDVLLKQQYMIELNMTIWLKSNQILYSEFTICVANESMFLITSYLRNIYTLRKILIVSTPDIKVGDRKKNDFVQAQAFSGNILPAEHLLEHFK